MKSVLLVLLCTLGLGAQPKPQAVFKVDLEIREADDQRRENTRRYSLIIDDVGSGWIRSGKRIPVDRDYIDVGVNVDCRVWALEGDLARLQVEVEISNADSAPRPVIQQMRSKVQAQLPLGKPTLVTAMQDPVLLRRYDLVATVTRVP